MNITAVKYRRKGQQDLTGFRIPSPTGERRNFGVYHGTTEEIDSIIEALRFGLSGDKRGSITHVALQLVADGGDTWVIERGPGHQRVLCNGQEKKFAHDGDLWSEILDFDSGSFQANDDSYELFQVFDLHARGEQLEASTKRHQQQLTPLRGITQVIDNLQADIYRAFHVTQQTQLADLVLLAKKLEPLYSEWRILEQIRARQTAPVDGVTLAKAEEAVNRLRQEVKILEDIQRESHQLLDPAFSPSSLRDRLLSLSERQAELKQELEGIDLPPRLHDIPWEQVLSILGRLHAFHHFWQATEQVWTNAAAHLPKAIEQHHAAIQAFAQQDRLILEEFEYCLSQLSDLLIEPERVEDETNKTLGKFIDRIKGKPLQAELSPSRERRGSLEGARTAVETALRKLSEVHASLAELSLAKDTALSDLDALRHRLNGDYNKIRSKWQELCLQWKLPVNLSLKTALRCLLVSAELGKLNYEEVQINLKLNSLRDQASTLEPLIKEWRRLIGSAKSTPIDTLSLLISETRSACDMLPKKSALLVRASADLTVRQSLLSYASELEKQREEVRVAWAKSFLDHNFAVAGLTETQWPEVFAQMRAMDLLQVQVDRSRDKLVDLQIFAQSLPFWPLIVFTWSGLLSHNRDRLRLMELIDKAPNEGYGLLLITEPTLADMLVNMGLPKAITLTSRQSSAESQERRPSPAGQAATPGMTDVDIGDKARAALAMLQGLGVKTLAGPPK